MHFVLIWMLALVNVFKMHCVHCVVRSVSVLLISMAMCASNLIFDIRIWFWDWILDILMGLNEQFGSITVISKSFASNAVTVNGFDGWMGPFDSNVVNSMYLSNNWLHNVGCFKKLADNILFCRFVDVRNKLSKTIKCFEKVVSKIKIGNLYIIYLWLINCGSFDIQIIWLISQRTVASWMSLSCSSHTSDLINIPGSSYVKFVAIIVMTVSVLDFENDSSTLRKHFIKYFDTANGFSLSMLMMRLCFPKNHQTLVFWFIYFTISAASFSVAVVCILLFSCFDFVRAQLPPSNDIDSSVSMK